MTQTNISRRAFLRASAAAIAAGAGHAADDARPVRPNIVLISTDQQHWRAFGAADPFFDTPNIDALAKSGTVFTDAFCTTPQCSASRASLYTGLYPHRTGVIGNMGSVRHDGAVMPQLPEGIETLGSRLRGAGYHTAYFGKWHLGNADHFKGHFDISELDGDAQAGATDKAAYYLEHRRQSPETPFALFVNYVNPHDIYEFTPKGLSGTIEPPAAPVPLPESWRDDLSRKPPPQLQYLREDQGRLIFNKPRVYWEKYRELYREKCRLADIEIGTVLNRLDALGLAGSTIVVLTSDHGDMDTHHGLIFKGPFLYENLVRVPLVVRVPPACGGIAPGAAGAFAVLTDVLPTLCGFAGADPGAADGVSLQPFLTGAGPAPEREYVIGQYYGKQRWVNPIRMIRTRAFKYTRYIRHGEELYDLANDPDEVVNLANDPSHRDTKRALADTLDCRMRENGDTQFGTYWSTDREGNRLS